MFLLKARVNECINEDILLHVGDCCNFTPARTFDMTYLGHLIEGRSRLHTIDIISCTHCYQNGRAQGCHLMQLTSSSTSIFGLRINARAMAILCICSANTKESRR